MSLVNIIMAEHSRAQAVMIADIILQKPSLLDELVDIILADEEPVSRRAAWPLRFIHEKNEKLTDKYLPKIISSLPDIKSVAIQRNLLYVIAYSSIPQSYKGELLEYTSQILLNSSSAVAPIIYSIDIFLKISKDEPDLLNELELIIEHLIPNATAGVLSKSRHTLRKINKLKSH